MLNSGMDRFTENIEEMFYVSISYEHEFKFEANQSKTVEQTRLEITQEVRRRASRALKFIDSMNFLPGFFYIYLIFKCAHVATIKDKNDLFI
jgi:hypothetical protein